MNLTRTIPHDSNGNVYYGPRSKSEGIKRIEELSNEPGISLPAAVERIVSRMIDAGFKKEAAAVKKYFKADLKKY